MLHTCTNVPRVWVEAKPGTHRIREGEGKGGGRSFVFVADVLPFHAKRCNTGLRLLRIPTVHTALSGLPEKPMGGAWLCPPQGGRKEGRVIGCRGPRQRQGRIGWRSCLVRRIAKDLSLWSPKWPMIPIIESYQWTHAAPLPRMTSANCCWWVCAVLARLNRVPLCCVSRTFAIGLRVSSPRPQLPPLGMTISGVAGSSRFG
jgi:hypothetical protein